MSQDPKLAYVLFVDIVGYSQELTPTQAEVVQLLNRLTRKCETYRRLKKRRKVVAGPSGDGFALAFFDEMGAPARCAYELAARVEEAGQFHLRMAGHVGPVEVREDITDDPNVFGEGVNVASRALRFSEPGELVVTGRLADLLAELPEFVGRLEPIGVETAKHGLEIELYRVLGPRSEALVPPRDKVKAERIREASLKKGKPSVAAVPTIARRLERIRRDVLVGLLLFFALEAIHFGVERFSLATNLKMWAYAQLHAFMPQPTHPVPVQVIALGEGFRDAAGVTRRDALASLLTQLGVADQAPAAIGVDIVFDNVRSQMVDPDGKPVLDAMGKPQEVPSSSDPEGLVGRAVLALAQGNPPVDVYVGVREPDKTHPLQVFPPDLGPARLARHVTHVWGPGGDSFDRRYLYGDMDFLPNVNEQNDERIGGLARSVVRSAEIAKARVPKQRQWAAPELPNTLFQLVERDTIWIEIAGRPIYRGEQFLMNYSMLPQLKAQTIKLEHPELTPSQQREVTEATFGRAVFIGRNDDEADMHLAPNGQQVAGVYYHAVAAATLMCAPIVSFKFLPGLIFGASTSLVVLLVAAAFRRINVDRPHEVSDQRLRSLLGWVLAGLVVVAAFLMLRLWGILWTEFPLVVLALLLDPLLEPKVEQLGHGVAHWAQHSLRRRVYQVK